MVFSNFRARHMAKADSLEPITQAVHLCIDMQNIFSSRGVWPTPWMERVLPGTIRREPSSLVSSRRFQPTIDPAAGDDISRAGTARRDPVCRRKRWTLSARWPALRHLRR